METATKSSHWSRSSLLLESASCLPSDGWMTVLTPLPEDFKQAEGQVRSTTEFCTSDFAVASYVSVGLHGRVKNPKRDLPLGIGWSLYDGICGDCWTDVISCNEP